MLAWFVTGLISVLAATAAFRGLVRLQRRLVIARLAKAIAEGDVAELAMLLAERVELRATPEWFGQPAVILAVESAGTGCALATVGLLLAHGAHVDERGTEWRTALMYAAAEGQCEICEMLLSRGADPNAQDAFGRTAEWWAERAGAIPLASRLREAASGPGWRAPV